MGGRHDDEVDTGHGQRGKQAGGMGVGEGQRKLPVSCMMRKSTFRSPTHAPSDCLLFLPYLVLFFSADGTDDALLKRSELPIGVRLVPIAIIVCP